MGDHTDYNDGFVLPTVIPQQTRIEIAYGNSMHEVYSATLDRIVRFGSGALDDFARYVGGCMRVLEQSGVEIPPLRFRIASEVPVGAGLSSSAALEVAILRALDRLLDLNLDPEQVACLAHQAEVEFAGGDGDDDFASHDLPLHVSVGVVFARAVVMVSLRRRIKRR